LAENSLSRPALGRGVCAGSNGTSTDVGLCSSERIGQGSYNQKVRTHFAGIGFGDHSALLLLHCQLLHTSFGAGCRGGPFMTVQKPYIFLYATNAPPWYPIYPLLISMHAGSI